MLFKIKVIYQATPTVITWELWKRSNTIQHGGKIFFNRLVHGVNRTLHYLVRVRYPKRVTQQPPHNGWYKCNTGGTSKANPRPSSYGYCMRNCVGDLIFAKALEIDKNIVSEEKRIVEGLACCVEKGFMPSHFGACFITDEEDYRWRMESSMVHCERSEED